MVIIGGGFSPFHRKTQTNKKTHHLSFKKQVCPHVTLVGHCGKNKTKNTKIKQTKNKEIPPTSLFPSSRCHGGGWFPGATAQWEKLLHLNYDGAAYHGSGDQRELGIPRQSAPHLLGTDGGAQWEPVGGLGQVAAQRGLCRAGPRE